MSKIIQYGLAVVLGIVFIQFQHNIEGINSICLVLILLFGIPHGGVDHLIHTSTSSNSGLLKYILNYLMIAVAYIIWWIIDPSKALFIFIILSAYHFGQEFIADIGIKSQKILLNLIWGGVILISPMLFNYQEITQYVQVIVSDLPMEIHPIWQYAFPAFSILLAGGSILWCKKTQGTSTTRLIQMSLFLLMITVSYSLLSFVHAFTIYFILFHSLNAFRHQFSWLSKRRKNYNIGKFVTDLTGFSLLAILGILSLLWILKPDMQTSLITYFFILTSLITLPHAITLDQFYRFRSKSNN